MNKTLFISSVTFVLGFYLAWALYPQLNQMLNPKLESNTSPTPSKETTTLQRKQNPQSESQNPEASFPDYLNALIQRNDVDTVVDTFNQLDLNKIDNKRLFQDLEKHILGLIEQKQYALAEGWLEHLLAQGFTQFSLYLMRANISEIKNQTYEALEYLYLAKYYSNTQDEIALTQKEINQFIKRQVKAYKNDQLHKTALFSLLQYATEKQAEHALFNIELAKLQFEQGESQRALNTLAIIPYSERYQDEVDKLTNRWSTHLAEIAVEENGIPLEKMGSHFIVDVSIKQSPSIRLILDTGASISAINQRTSQQLLQEGLIEETRKIIRVNTANGDAQVKIFKAYNFALNEFSIESISLASIHMENNPNVDGLLGMDFLGAFRFEIDYEGRLLYLKSSSN